MSIEKEIRKAIQEFTFNKRLPEFVDRAKYLESKLKEDECLLVKIDEHQLVGPARDTADFIYLELHRVKEIEPMRVLTLDCLGGFTYWGNFFEDYKPFPESRRKR